MKNVKIALTGVTSWVEHRPANQKVAGLIHSQGTCLGGRPCPQLGVCKRQPIDVSLIIRCLSPSLSPSLPLCL